MSTLQGFRIFEVWGFWDLGFVGSGLQEFGVDVFRICGGGLCKLFEVIFP